MRSLLIVAGVGLLVASAVLSSLLVLLLGAALIWAGLAI